jgi:fatty-acyl-CoA synthase
MFVNDFPINISGKIMKFKMREESINVLGLHEADKIETA